MGTYVSEKAMGTLVSIDGDRHQSFCEIMKAGGFLYTVGDHLLRVTHDDRREWLGDQESNLGSQIQNLLSCP